MVVQGTHQYPIVGAVTSILISRSLSTADVVQLFKSYQSTTPPPAKYLQSPLMIDLLLKAVFDPGAAGSTVNKMQVINCIPPFGPAL